MKFINRWAQTTKTVEEGWSSCFKKHFYSTLELAVKVAIRRMKEDKCTLYVYKCSVCSNYHLSTKKYKTSIDINPKTCLTINERK